MTDEMDRLKRELREAAPSGDARETGIAAAMAAFEQEFGDGEKQSGDAESNSDRQGSGSAARHTDRKGAEGRRRRRSDSMRDYDDHSSGRGNPSRKILARKILSRKALLYGGSSIAAMLALLVVSGHAPSGLLPGGGSEPTIVDAERKERPAGQGELRPRLAEENKEKADGDDAVAQAGESADGPARLADPAPPSAAPEPEAKPAKPAQPAIIGRLLEDRQAADEGRALDGLFAGDLDRGATELPAPTTGARPASEAESDGRVAAAEALRPEPKKLARKRDAESGYILFAPGDEAAGQGGLKFKDAPSRDRFEALVDNPVKRVAEAPVSTFSADVDTGAYSFMRASLNRGQLPPRDAVRVEELINYFDYAYAPATSAEEPFNLNVAVAPTPWNAGTKLLHIGVKGYQPPEAQKPKANLVFLIDVSGSMQAENKLPLAVNSFKLLLDRLGEEDTISIVTYANGVRAALEPTRASERAKILKALDGLTAGGGTAGADGLRLAYEKAAESYDEMAVNRVILATDGDFNIGFSSPDEMKAFIEKKRDSGVFLSVLGFGTGNYNSHLMQSLAQNGNGVAAYIDTLSEARKALADESGGAIIPIAKDVKIQVEFNPAVISEYRLIGYETRALPREDFKNDAVDAGDVGSGHSVTAIYEITPKGSPAELFEAPRYASGAPEAAPVSDGGEIAYLKLRYKAPDGAVSREISRAVTEADEAASLEAAPQETRFAAAVAAFGQLLRRNGRLGEFDYDDVLALGAAAKGEDPFGYRAEFLTLARLAKSLDGRSLVAPAKREE